MFAFCLIPLGIAFHRHSEREAMHQRAVDLAPHLRETVERNCYSCQGRDPERIDKDLIIFDHGQLLDTLVIPGNPIDLHLLQRIEGSSMLPEAEEVPLLRLTERYHSMLKEWIQGGAPALPRRNP